MRLVIRMSARSTGRLVKRRKTLSNYKRDVFVELTAFFKQNKYQNIVALNFHTDYDYKCEFAFVRAGARSSDSPEAVDSIIVKEKATRKSASKVFSLFVVIVFSLEAHWKAR